ncbi:MAG: hypothetical protein GY832_20085 [Chloroflexi bacterium]|nr:hypothetical protein [Chloroflexota bacterium]
MQTHNSAVDTYPGQTNGAVAEIKTYLSVTGAHSDQVDGFIAAHDGNGKYVGHLDWTEYDSQVFIKWIEVQRKREGIGTRLVETLRAEFPHAPIDWGYTTPEGAALKESMS